MFLTFEKTRYYIKHDIIKYNIKNNKINDNINNNNNICE